jgi:hypothetical protein
LVVQLFVIYLNTAEGIVENVSNIEEALLSSLILWTDAEQLVILHIAVHLLSSSANLF